MSRGWRGAQRDVGRAEDICAGRGLGTGEKKRKLSSPMRVTATATSDADFATGLIQSSIEARSVFIVIQHYYL